MSKECVREIFKKVTQRIPAMGFNVLQLEQNVLPNASTNQEDGDQVGVTPIQIMYSGEQNVSSVAQKRSQVRNWCNIQR